MIGSALVSVIMIALIAGALWFFSTQIPSTPAITQEVSYPLAGADHAEVHIDFNVGTLRIGALYESDNLLEGTLDLSKNEELIATHSDKKDAFLALDSKMPPLAFSTDLNQDKTWDIYLNRDVRIELDVNTGVGTAKLDLRQLDLGDLNVNSGVGKTTVILPEKGRFAATVEGGVGQVVIDIPEGMQARIEMDTGLGNVQAPDSYQRSGDTFTSPGYQSADDRVDLVVESGLGQIVVREYKGE